MISYGIMQGRLTPSRGRGIQFFPFENWNNEFEICRKLNLQEIEFIFDYDDYVNNPLWTDEGVARINSLINTTGTRVRSLCFDYFMRRAFYKRTGELKERLREENKSVLLKMFEAMSRIGGELIEIPSVDDSSIKNEIEKSEYRNFLKEILDLTDESFPHIKIGLETDLMVGDFVGFIDSIGSSRLGANYDSGNSSGLGYDLYDEVVKLGKRVLNVHIKDRIYRGTTVALGTGSADFDKLFKGLKEIGYDRSFIIQAARGSEDQEELTIEKQRDFIKKYVARYGLED